MYNFAFCLITPKVSLKHGFEACSSRLALLSHLCVQSGPQGPQGSSTDTAYFVLVDTYLKFFLPTEGSVPASPFADSRGSVSAPSPRSSCSNTGELDTESSVLILRCPLQVHQRVLCWLQCPQSQPAEASHIPSAICQRRPGSPGDLEV